MMLRITFVALLAASATAFSTTSSAFVRPPTTATSALSMTANESGEKVVGDDGITNPNMVKDSAKESIADKAKNAQRAWATKSAEIEEKLKADDEDEGFGSMEMMFHKVVNDGSDGFGTLEMVVNDDGVTSPDMVKDDAKGREAFKGASQKKSD